MDSEKSKTEERDLPEKSPKRGPTLSTSTSSFEALDPHDPQLNHLASVMFSKTSDWIAGSVLSWIAFFSYLQADILLNPQRVDIEGEIEGEIIIFHGFLGRIQISGDLF